MADRPPPDRATKPLNADPYAVLGVRPGSTAREIRAAFHRKAVRLHPDKAVLRSSIESLSSDLPASTVDRESSAPAPLIERRPPSVISAVNGDADQAESEVRTSAHCCVGGAPRCLQGFQCQENFIMLVEAYRALLPKQASRDSTMIAELWTRRTSATPIKRSQLTLLEPLPDDPQSLDSSGSGDALFFTCRCGDDLIIEKEELEMGVDLVDCSACSMTYRLAE